MANLKRLLSDEDDSVKWYSHLLAFGYEPQEAFVVSDQYSAESCGTS